MLVQNIADLKLTNGALLTDDLVKVSGYYTANDAGGGDFYWDSTSVEAEDGGTIFAAAGVATGRWKRRHSSVVYAKWFGVKGDKVSDDTICLQNAINYCTLHRLCLDITNLVISVKPQQPAVSGIATSITCDLYGGGTGMIISNVQTVGGGAVYVTRSNVTIDGVTFDGNLTNAPASNAWTQSNWSGSNVVNTVNGQVVPVTGVTALSIYIWATPDDDGATSIAPSTARVVSNVVLKNCVFQNTLGVAIRISGFEHKLINCTTKRSVGNFGDGFLADGAYNISFHQCKAYDFMRIGFCSDLSGAMQGNRNIYYYDCVAEYGHDCGREYGAGEANSGFWAENTADVGYYNCKAIDCGVNGFNYNQATPGPESFMKQTKSGVVFDNCVVDYMGRISNVIGAGIVAHSDPTYRGGQQYMHVVISNCKIEHAANGIDIRVANPADTVIVENTYVNSRRINVDDSTIVELYIPIVIFAGGSPDSSRASVFINNVKFKHWGGTDQDVANANTRDCFGSEIAVIRYAEASSLYNGDLKAINLFIDNVYKDNNAVVTVKGWYSSRSGDNVEIKNSPNVQFGGQAKSLKLKNVGSFNFTPVALNVDDFYMEDSVWYNYANLGLYDFPVTFNNLYVKRSQLTAAWFVIINDCRFVQNTITDKVQLEFYGTAGTQHVLDVSGNIFTNAGVWPLQLKANVANVFSMRLSDNTFLANSAVFVTGNAALQNIFFGSGNYYAGGGAPMQMAGNNYLAADLFKPITNDYILKAQGTTANRPAGATFGFRYIDTTLSKEITSWGGGVWKDAMGNIV